MQSKEAKRLEEWREWIGKFIMVSNEGGKQECASIEYAPELTNIYYWRLVNDFLKPMLKFTLGKEEHNLHFYKIISASEIAIMAVLPLKYKDGASDKERRKLNALFAWFVSTSIMLSWKIDSREVCDEATLTKVVENHELIDIIGGKEKKYAYNFMEEHIEWLSDLNVAGNLPILINSQTWRMVFIATKALKNEL